MKKNTSSIELIKRMDEIDLVASFILNITLTEKQNFIFLKGDIGSGKTTLVKAIAKQLGEESSIISPSFNKMFVYDKLVHIDAYNMENQTLEEFNDYFDDKLVIIEWPEKLKQKFNFGFQVEILFENENSRKYKITWME